MSVESYYNETWKAGEYVDPLASERHALLWELADRAGVQGGRYAEIGCGAGTLTREAVDRGFDAVGMDISSVVLDLAREKVPEAEFIAHSTDERPWPVEDGTFDLAVAFEVIEHVYFVRELLMGCRAALRPGGHLALSTPYHGRLKNLALALWGFDRHFWVEGQHIRFFTDRALRYLLEDCGFAVRSLRHQGRAAGLWAGTLVWAQRLEREVPEPGARLRNPPPGY